MERCRDEGAGSRPSRREALRCALGVAASLAIPPGARGGDAGEAGRGDGLVVRGRRPLNAETPVEVLDRWLTPNDLFFVRSHFGAPAVGLHPWRLEIRGEVERPLTLTLEDLAAFEERSRPAVLQCAGNGRALFRPRIPGVGWERGAVGQAEWGGVRLADVLAKAGLKLVAAHVHLLGADLPPAPKTPPYLRSLPLDRALADDTLLATTMNGEPLPVLHGGPIRVIVPTWSGNHWIKWLRTITVARDEAPGFYMQTGYKMPKVPTPPGVDLKPEDLVPVTTMNVKSLIAWPPRGGRVPPGRHEVRGVAWTGTGTVTRVEVDTGSGWVEARFGQTPAIEGAWRTWSAPWRADRPGRAVVRARATDSNGQTQPEVPAWNKSGYHWNGIESVECEVG